MSPDQRLERATGDEDEDEDADEGADEDAAHTAAAGTEGGTRVGIRQKPAPRIGVQQQAKTKPVVSQ
jgi:hypothetical protein